MGRADSLSLLVSVFSVEHLEIPRELNTRTNACQITIMIIGVINFWFKLFLTLILILIFPECPRPRKGARDPSPLILHILHILHLFFCALYVSR